MIRARRKRVGWWCAITFCAYTFGISVAFSLDQKTEDDKYNAAVRVFWVDPRGRIIRNVTIDRAVWVWRKRFDHEVRPLPALRLSMRIGLSKSTKILVARSRNAWLAQPFTQSTEPLLVDVQNTESSVDFVTEVNGKQKESSLAIVISVQEPLILKHPRCATVDTEIVSTEAHAKNLFIALDCQTSGDKTDFALIKSQDAMWLPSDRTSRQPATNSDVIETDYSKQSTNPLDVRYQKVTDVSLADQFGGKTNYHLNMRPVPTERIGPPSISGGLGITSLSYSQTFFRPFSQTALTAKIAYQQPLRRKNWDVAASTYFTTLVLSSSEPNAAARFLGINARVGYTFESIKDPWRVSLLGGWYYATMFVSGTRIGYKHLQGPQLFPTVKYKFKDKWLASMYFKYSPVSSVLSILPVFESREIALGVGVTRIVRNHHSVGFFIDYSNLSFALLNRSINSTTYSLSLSYNYLF